jgi:protein-disulfide isomerase
MHTHDEQPTSKTHTGKKIELTVPMAIVIGACIIAVSVLITWGPKRTPKTGPVPAEQLTQMIENILSSRGSLPVSSVKPSDHVRGSKNPVLTIIEYSDFECPYCKSFHTTMKSVLKKHGEKVAWVYRHFPLDCEDNTSTQCRVLHENARIEAMASECAANLGGNDAFWYYADTLFAETTSNDGISLDRLPIIAESIGIQKDAFNTCLSTKATAERVSTDAKEGIKANVTGTPTSFIVDSTGVSYKISGGYPFEAVDAVIKQLLKN